MRLFSSSLTAPRTVSIIITTAATRGHHHRLLLLHLLLVLLLRVREITTATRSGPDVLHFRTSEVSFDGSVTLGEGLNAQTGSIFLPFLSRKRIARPSVKYEAHAFILPDINALPNLRDAVIKGSRPLCCVLFLSPKAVGSR
jgi:hypothetical protein